MTFECSTDHEETPHKGRRRRPRELRETRILSTQLPAVLDINEIFFSIQGESSRMGKPCIFVRLSMCNLRCSWCDTEYAFTRGTPMTFDEICARIHSYPCHLVMVTGGEPLLQEPVFALMENLCDTGYEVVLETSGSVDISHVDPRVHRIVDVKCPGSGMQDACRIQDIPLLTDRDEVKFVIRDRTDYEYAREFIATHSIHDRCTVLMSPVFGELPNVRLAEWILEDGLPVRYQVQLHKYIWEPQTRGV